MEKTSLSIVLPVYNEERLLSYNIGRLIGYLDNLNCVSDYEIIVSDNGSSDKTKDIMEDLLGKYKHLKFISINKRSIGLGILNGIKKSKMNYIMYYAIDLPFGFGIIKDSIISITQKNQVIIGSKYHRDSKIRIPPKRILLSRIYYAITLLLFNLKVKDSQGSLLFSNESIKNVLKYLDSESSFLLTQIILYLKLIGDGIKEIPVKYLVYRQDSKMNLLKDSFSMLEEALSEHKRYKRIKKVFKPRSIR